MFINAPSQQPDCQLQKGHITKSQIIKYNKQGTYVTYTYATNYRKLKYLISIFYNKELIIKLDSV
jgi:hypothetical protein